MMTKYITLQKKVDVYDIGNGLTLMNILTKNADGKLERIDTYIGMEGNGFSCVGVTQDLAAPGTLFDYARYIRMMKANIDMYIRIFYENIHK